MDFRRPTEQLGHLGMELWTTKQCHFNREIVCLCVCEIPACQQNINNQTFHKHDPQNIPFFSQQISEEKKISSHCQPCQVCVQFNFIIIIIIIAVVVVFIVDASSSSSSFSLRAF